MEDGGKYEWMESMELALRDIVVNIGGVGNKEKNINNIIIATE